MYIVIKLNNKRSIGSSQYRKLDEELPTACSILRG